MVKKISFLLLLLSLSLFIRAQNQGLSSQHKEWLKLVTPIITETEKDVFLQLKTQKERETFIRLFWKKRDPLLDTEKNEFREEYIERVHYADRNFGFDTPKRGSQTERGYFYLLLGPPLNREVYATHSQLWPTEIWYYKGDPKLGLPAYFYLIFYKPQGIGEYRLYSPGIDTPQALVVPSASGQALDRTSAYRIIKRISAELAEASLSYIPAETSLSSSLSSDILISRIHNLAEKKFSDTYAQEFLTYKDYVETDYTHNYIESYSKVKVFKNYGQPYIHWSLEPSQINFSTYKDKYYASFQLITRIEDTKGNVILEKDEEISLSITPQNYKQHQHQLFAFQDVVPIIPGNYKFFFLLKNKTAQDFTSFQTEVKVPSSEDFPCLSNLLLYLHQEGKEELTNKFRAFSFSENQYIVNSQNNFLQSNKLGVYAQVYGIEKIEGKYLLMEIFPLDSSTPVFQEKKLLSEFLSRGDNSIRCTPISLSSLSPGYYKAKISILDKKQDTISSQKENFVIYSQHQSVIPWVYSKLHPAFPNFKDLFLLGSQYFSTKKYKKAKLLLEEALKRRKDNRTILLLAKTHLALEDYKKSIQIAQSVYKANRDREAAKIIAFSYTALKEWKEALPYLTTVLEQAQEIKVLNLAAKCYLNLNLPQKAFPLLQKSLKLNPHQPEIEELERKIKESLNY